MESIRPGGSVDGMSPKLYTKLSGGGGLGGGGGQGVKEPQGGRGSG